MNSDFPTTGPIVRTLSCPACRAEKSRVVADGPTGLYRCGACGCIHGSLYLGESYGVVKPYMTGDPDADARAIPFDFQTLGSAGIGRRHGFFDPQTRLVTQVG